MNHQIKVLRGLDRGDYIIMITRGAVDITGFEQILDKVIDATGPLLDCKILVDFQDSIFQFLPSDITNFLPGLTLRDGLTITKSHSSLHRGKSNIEV